MNKIKIYSILSIVILSHLLSIYSDNLRYIKYLILPLSIFFFATSKKNSYVITRKYYISFICLYSIASIMTFFDYFFQMELNIRYFANIFFVFSAIIPAYYISMSSNIKDVDKYLKFLFISFVSLFFIELLYKGKLIAIISNNYSEAIYNSNISTESGLSFVFCLFFVYFLTKKNTVYTFLALSSTIISFKRISIAVLIVTILIYFIPDKLQKSKKSKYMLSVFGLASLMLYIYLAINFAQGRYDDYLSMQFNMSANHLTQGRQTLYKLLIDKEGYINWVGIGLGRIDIVTTKYLGSNTNIHSDIFKLYFEFGIIMFSAWLIVFFKFHMMSKKLVMSIVALMILFLTDNVFIYLHVMLVFYLITTQFLMHFEIHPNKAILGKDMNYKSNQRRYL